jgi:hypothetical protein
MLIDPNSLSHWIANFYGYGSWNAPAWFIAHEEDGGNLPEEVAGKLNYFFQHHPPGGASSLCDIRELYRHVPFSGDGPRAESFSNFYDYRFGNKAVQHGIWKNLIALVHGYRNRKLPDQLKFQKVSFCLPAKEDVALLRLYPLPSPHNHGWYYSWLELPPEFAFVRNRASYEAHLFIDRVREILGRIHQHKPELVLMYGMNNINALKQAVQDSFIGTKFRITKATKLKIPQYHHADLNGTTLLITTQIPALRHNRVETGFDWWEVGKSLMRP